MTIKEKEEEYLRRNLIYAKSAGVLAGIQSVVNRLNRWKHPPKWATEMLNREIPKAEAVREEMDAHREEMAAGRESILKRAICDFKPII